MITIWSCHTYQCDGECGNTEVLNDLETELGTVVTFDNIEDRKEHLQSSDDLLTVDVIVWDLVSVAEPVTVDADRINQMFANINAAYEPVGIQFRMLKSNVYTDYFTFEDLAEDNYEKYYFEIIQNNSESIIDLYLVDHEKGLCFIDGNTRGCQKGKGFTSTGGWTSSIVIAKDDITDMKIPTHEFGHFFNLEHTFKGYDEKVNHDSCDAIGDYICDTPADPGDGYGAMVNYTDCEMYGVFDEEGIAYKPMINNYMGYFSACYMTPYAFTQGQIDRMKTFIYDEKRIGYLKTSEEL